MKTNWQTKKIGDVTKICLGLTHTPKYVEKGVPFLSVKDISQGSINFNNTRFISREEFISMPEGAKPKKDDILFCRVGSIGYPQILNEEKEFGIFVSLGFFRVKKEILFNRYLAYWMESPSFDDQVKENVRGSTLKNLNTGWLKNFNILLPFLFEQKRIVKILDDVFEKLEEVKENTEKNLQNSRELFESYLQSIFSNKRWEVKRLGEIANVEYGFTDRAKDTGDFRYVRITDINDYGNLESTNKMYINFAKEAEKFLLEDNDILMARTGATFAKVLLYKNIEKSVFASYLIRIRFTEKIVNKLYWYFSKSKFYWDQANRLSSGSAQPQFNGGALKQLIFRYPKPFFSQKKVVQKLDAFSAKTKELEEVYKQKLADLKELKKSILSRAFAGEL